MAENTAVFVRKLLEVYEGSYCQVWRLSKHFDAGSEGAGREEGEERAAVRPARTSTLPATHTVSACDLLQSVCQTRIKVRALRCTRSHIVVAPGGTLKNVSIGVKPAESVTDALAAVAGDGAVPQAEAAEADEEKKEAAAEEEPAAEDKKAEPEVIPWRAAA